MEKEKKEKCYITPKREELRGRRCVSSSLSPGLFLPLIFPKIAKIELKVQGKVERREKRVKICAPFLSFMVTYVWVREM